MFSEELLELDRNTVEFMRRERWADKTTRWADKTERWAVKTTGWTDKTTE